MASLHDVVADLGVSGDERIGCRERDVGAIDHAAMYAADSHGRNRMKEIVVIVSSCFSTGGQKSRCVALALALSFARVS